MQHLGYCLPSGQTACRQLKPSLRFSENLYKLSCSCTVATKWNTTAVFFFSDFKTELFIWFFVEESVASQRDSSMVAVVTVHAGSYGGQQVKSFSYKDFKFLTILVLPLPPQNEKQLVWAGLRHGIQVQHKGFCSSFRASLTRLLKNCIQDEPE